MEILLCEIPYKFKRKVNFHAFIYYVHEFVETPKERRGRWGNNFGKKNQKTQNHQIKITKIKIKMENLFHFFQFWVIYPFKKKFVNEQIVFKIM
jgi:hypothetical protein